MQGSLQVSANWKAPADRCYFIWLHVICYMRRFLLLICMLFGKTGYGQRVQSDCTVPQNLFNAYQRDVADLAIKRMQQNNHPDLVKVDIPAVHTDSIWNALSAVFRLGTVGETDSVFTHFCIHTHAGGLMLTQSVEVKVDTTQAWTQAWLSGQTATGYVELDAFLSRYAYSAGQVYYSSSIGIWVTLNSTQINNGRAFADSLLNFSGILSTAANMQYGDGELLFYDRDSVSHIGFKIGMGDCINGCILNKYWYYSVSDACVVTVDSIIDRMSPYGRPPLTNCGLIPNALTVRGVSNYPAVVQMAISPNPVLQVLQLPVSIPIDASCRIYSAVGQLVLAQDVSISRQLDVSTLPVGLYSILVTSNHIDVMSLGRFVKQ